MATSNKSKLEQGIVVGMLVIFAIRLPIMLRSLGIVGRQANGPITTSASPVDHPQTTQPVPDRVQEPPREMQAQNGPDAIVPVVKYTADTVRDPLISLLPKEPTGQARPATVTASNTPLASPQPPSIVVRGMIWGGSRPQALLDGQLYDLGDTVQGATIVAITQGGVMVEIGGARFLLSPPKGSNASGNPRNDVSIHTMIKPGLTKQLAVHPGGEP